MAFSVQEQYYWDDLVARVEKLEVHSGLREAPPPPLTPEQAEAKHAAEVLGQLGPEGRSFLAKLLAAG